MAKYLLVGEEDLPRTFVSGIFVDESKYKIVEDEAALTKALQDGRSPVLRGLVPCTTAKVVTHDHTHMKAENGGGLIFTLNPADAPVQPPRAITIEADDCVFSDFRLTSTVPIATTTAYGLVFSEQYATAPLKSHRTRIERMEIYNWARCISKDGGDATPWTEDVLVDRCYFHTFNNVGANINFGFIRFHMRDTRILGRVGSENHTTHNAVNGGANWQDNTFENCIFGNVARMGWEAMTPGYEYENLRTKVIGCRSENCGYMGFSLGFGEGGVFDRCVAKNVRNVGFELCGRGPGYPGPPPDPGHRYGQGIIVNCEVDGVHAVGLPSYGISFDGARDSMISGGTRISNVTSTLAGGGAVGLVMQACQRCSVIDTEFSNAGNCPIYVIPWYLPNTSGFHMIIGNTFRNAAGNDPAIYRSISVENVSAVVQDNISWQGAGMLFGYKCNNSAPAQVFVDGTPVAYGAQTFGGSNRIHPVT